MALEDIFRALEEQADRDVVAVLEEARAHAAVILEEAERDAKRTRDTRIAEAERIAVARSSQDLNVARLDARKAISHIKDRAVGEVFDAARKSLAGVRQRPDYDRLFLALAEEALRGLTGDFEVLVDPADEDRMRALLAEKGITAQVKPDLESAGGVVVAMNKGTVMRRNTLEDRLEKLSTLAQVDVAEIVFA